MKPLSKHLGKVSYPGPHQRTPVGRIKSSAHNNAIGDRMTDDTVIGDNQLGDKPESQEALLKLCTGHGLKK